MEKSQYRLRVTPPRDRIVVHPGRYLFGMEVVWTEFTSVDS
jgi:hypothetical protein